MNYKNDSRGEYTDRYTFNISYNISHFSVRLTNSTSTILGNGDSATIDLRDGYNADNTPHFSRVGGEVFSLALDPATNWQRVVTIEEVVGSKFGANTIYGNDVANKLTGGDKKDMLYGGAGNDTLDGGAGTGDRTEGGAGNDTYLFTGAFGGNEFVVDSDGSGNIVIDGVTLAGTARIVTNTSTVTLGRCKAT